MLTRPVKFHIHINFKPYPNVKQNKTECRAWWCNPWNRCVIIEPDSLLGSLWYTESYCDLVALRLLARGSELRWNTSKVLINTTRDSIHLTPGLITSTCLWTSSIWSVSAIGHVLHIWIWCHIYIILPQMTLYVTKLHCWDYTVSICFWHKLHHISSEFDDKRCHTFYVVQAFLQYYAKLNSSHQAR